MSQRVGMARAQRLRPCSLIVKRVSSVRLFPLRVNLERGGPRGRARSCAEREVHRNQSPMRRRMRELGSVVSRSASAPRATVQARSMARTPTVMNPILEGKVAIVTGSTSGIGEAIARLFAAEGAAVVVNSARSVAAGEALAAELPQAIYVRADVAREDQAKALVQATLDRWGRLDVLVNNAGTTRVIPHHALDAVTDEDWQRILGVNVSGPGT